MIMLDTAFEPKLAYVLLSSLAVPGESGAETLKWLDWDDTPGVSIGRSFQQSFSYRWRGEDTWDWGDPGKRIRAEWIAYLLFKGLLSSSEAFANANALLRQYHALQEILGHPRLSRIEEIYSLRDPPTIRQFLRTYPQLIDVLLEAYDYLRKYFGPDLQVTLEVVSDPEVEGMDELFAYILTSLPVDEALARLDRLDKEWFLDQLDRVDGRFNFNLEFV